MVMEPQNTITNNAWLYLQTSYLKTKTLRNTVSVLLKNGAQSLVVTKDK